MKAIGVCCGEFEFPLFESGVSGEQVRITATLAMTGM
jgi:hypothetical protein